MPATLKIDYTSVKNERSKDGLLTSISNVKSWESNTLHLTTRKKRNIVQIHNFPWTHKKTEDSR